MKFLVKSVFDTLSGYGNDGVGLTTAMEEAGHDVHLFPLWVTPPIPPQVASLLTKWPQPPFDASVVHLSPADSRLSSKPLRLSSPRLVWWTMWEYERFRPRGWEATRTAIEESEFDLLLAYDEVTATAMTDPEVNPGVPVHVLQGGFTPDYWGKVNPRDRDWSGTFRFSMVGRLDRRKNPWGAIRAFGKLKDLHGDKFDAELHLKTTIPGQFPPQIEERWPGIHIHLEWWPPDRLRQLYLDTHCLLAPSTGEGKNVPALEAMTTGVPVIATDYGGHRGWIDEAFAYPLSWTPHEYDEGPAAKPDEDELAELMWHVYTHRDEARLKGEVAARTIPPSMSWEAVIRRLVAIMGAWPLGEGRRDAVLRSGAGGPPMHGEPTPVARAHEAVG